MRYSVLIKKQAKKTLASLSRLDRQRITEKIVLLGINPNDPNLDIKALEGQANYRMRVGQWRIIFARDDHVKVIAIEKIKPRGDVYK